MAPGTRIALKLLLTTGQRRQEIVGARWVEFREADALWEIPANRTKNGRAHRVPLSELALQLLSEANQLSDGSVKHVTGGHSTLGMKAYNQGRGSFEGTAQHVIWLDEEPPMDVYGECLIRTATTNGIIMLTFTPLSGLSDVVLQFMPQEFRPDMD